MADFTREYLEWCANGRAGMICAKFLPTDEGNKRNLAAFARRLMDRLDCEEVDDAEACHKCAACTRSALCLLLGAERAAHDKTAEALKRLFDEECLAVKDAPEYEDIRAALAAFDEARKENKENTQ